MNEAEQIRKAIRSGERIGLLMQELALTYSIYRKENDNLKFMEFLRDIEDLDEEINEIINREDE